MTGFSKHLLPDPRDQARLLGDRKEFLGQQQPSYWVLPAHQRLRPDDPATLKRHNGLVIDLELSPLQGSPELVLQP
jgi:hypothetical protein